jgi:hypothetical protein
MEIAAVIILLIVAFAVGAKGGAGSQASIIDKLAVASAHDRMAFLNTLRREIANYLMWDDPDRFQQLSKVVQVEVSAYAEMTAKGRADRLKALTSKYPQYSDFDVIGTRVYVLYPDGVSWLGIEGLEGAYRDITNFQALLIASDAHWKYFMVADEGEHLAGYVREVHDTKLQLDIERAVGEYYRAGTQRGDVFDTPEYRVQGVEHFAENRLGVHVKETNEFGLYGFFIFDETVADGSPKIRYAIIAATRRSNRPAVSITRAPSPTGDARLVVVRCR